MQIDPTVDPPVGRGQGQQASGTSPAKARAGRKRKGITMGRRQPPAVVVEGLWWGELRWLAPATTSLVGRLRTEEMKSFHGAVSE